MPDAMQYNFGGIEGSSLSTDAGVFDFKAMEESEAAGSQVGKVKLYICPADVALLDGDGRDDLAIGGDDATQSGDDADINIGVGELQECTISKANDGIVVDDLIVMDSFDFKASEPTTATKTYYDFKMEDALISSWSSSGASETGYNDGVVDAADYVVWRNANADTVDIDLSLLAVDTGGVPVSMPEYAVMLF